MAQSPKLGLYAEPILLPAIDDNAAKLKLPEPFHTTSEPTCEIVTVNPDGADVGVGVGVGVSVFVGVFVGVSETDASGGVAVKKNDIPFTPGLVGAAMDFGPDLLEVDTLAKDVSLNGATFGGRAKLEVFTDFFFLETGANTIEFYDSSNSASNALLKVYYRSGWLG